jgi:hypothetical protein
VRTKLPELGVAEVVAEALLAHARPVIKGVYAKRDRAAEADGNQAVV